MNGHDPRDPEGLDPQLLQLFDAASQQTARAAPDYFVAATLLKMKLGARARLIRRCGAVAVIMTLGAILAPFIAAATLDAASWMVEHLPVAGMTLLAPLGCACAALLAWRIARRT